MRKFRSHLIGVDQGETILFSDFEDGGKMWVDQGPREVRKAISFSTPYTTVPAVTVNLVMWDMDGATNGRTDIRADSINLDGFEIVFRTWSDTRIARVRAAWQAIGELEDEDAWHLY